MEYVSLAGTFEISKQRGVEGGRIAEEELIANPCQLMPTFRIKYQLAYP